MRVTQKVAEAFVGGDMEIQNRGEDYLFRGPIERIVVEDDTLKVHFTWVARNDGGPSSPTSTWTSDDRLDYAASLEIYSASDIGEGRLCLTSSFTGELVVLFPPNGSKLDPARVAGLTLD